VSHKDAQRDKRHLPCIKYAKTDVLEALPWLIVLCLHVLQRWAKKPLSIPVPIEREYRLANAIISYLHALCAGNRLDTHFAARQIDQGHAEREPTTPCDVALLSKSGREPPWQGAYTIALCLPTIVHDDQSLMDAKRPTGTSTIGPAGYCTITKGYPYLLKS
jgi:hypothetical protein